MKKTIMSTMFVACLVITVMAQPSATYYSSARGKCGAELKTALFQIIKNPSVVDYDLLWDAFRKTDRRVFNDDEGEYIWDMYSNISRYPLNSYPHGTGANYPEGMKGVLREHVLVRTWFNPTSGPKSGKNYEDIRPMYSDIVHLIPTDAVCNDNRNDLCYAEVAEGQVDWQSEGGFSKKSTKGGCSTPGWTEQVANPTNARVFEPNDEYKGDMARIFFYMVTCYEPGFATWDVIRDEGKRKQGETLAAGSKHCGTWSSDMFDASSEDAYQPFAPWALDMLMRWAKNDPVSDKERARNEATWQIQGNRNPFVDFEGLEDYIWGDEQETPFDFEGEEYKEPTSGNCEVELNNATFGVDWSSTDNLRDVLERTPLTIEKNGVTITFNYGMNGQSLYADDDEIRLYNYNTLTIRAHNNELVKVEFTCTDKNHDNKYMVASVGDIEDNVWTGNASEVIFASNYVSSTKSGGVTKDYYLSLSDIKITSATKTYTVELTDNKAYTQQSQIDGVDVYYTRDFSKYWEAIYLPFSLKYEDWKDDFEVARINAVHQYDTNDDGDIDKTELEFVKIKSGSTYPNTPYIIRAKEKGKKTLYAENVTLYEAEKKSVECSTTTEKFIFTGNYKKVSSMDLMAYYTNKYTMHLGDINYINLITGVGAYRWYMERESRNTVYGIINNSANVREISIDVIDEETTGITDIQHPSPDTPTFDLNGRRVDENNLQPGIYVKNGKKFVVK
ncbi:MAG: endonuclease [Bacteroidaceae bacterium]|nr:endonuclease [Bacteroidaceae bacterium]